VCGQVVCEQVVCVSKLCVDKLCASKWCVSKLCASKLCSDKLCVHKLCVDKLWAAGRAGSRAAGRAGRKCTTKNKNPTQRCGEKLVDLFGFRPKFVSSLPAMQTEKAARSSSAFGSALPVRKDSDAKPS